VLEEHTASLYNKGKPIHLYVPLKYVANSTPRYTEDFKPANTGFLMSKRRLLCCCHLCVVLISHCGSTNFPKKNI